MDAKTQENLRKYGGTAFDFGAVNEDHTKAVKEACKILKEKNIDKTIIEELELKFKVKNLPKYKITESPFFQYCKKNNITLMEQGYVTVQEDGKIKLYPVGCVVEDIRILNKVFESIFNAGIEAAKQIEK